MGIIIVGVDLKKIFFECGIPEKVDVVLIISEPGNHFVESDFDVKQNLLLLKSFPALPELFFLDFDNTEKIFFKKDVAITVLLIVAIVEPHWFMRLMLGRPPPITFRGCFLFSIFRVIY